MRAAARYVRPVFAGSAQRAIVRGTPGGENDSRSSPGVPGRGGRSVRSVTPRSTLRERAPEWVADVEKKADTGAVVVRYSYRVRGTARWHDDDLVYRHRIVFSPVLLDRLSSLTVPSLAATALFLQACGGGGGGGGVGPGTSASPNIGNPDVQGETEEPDVPVPALADFPAAVAFDASTADVAGGSFYRGSVNTALLQGPPIVPEEFVGEPETRALPFAVGRSDPALALRYVGTPVEGDSSADIFAVVENIGGERRCFVDLDELAVLDTNGDPIDVFGLGGAFIDGGLTDVLGLTVDNCLEPGAKGHARFSVGAPSSDIGAVFVADLSSNPSGNDGPQASLEAVSYDVVDGDVRVTVANRGAEDVNLMRVTAYLIDAEGRAVGEDVERGLGTVAPGAEVVAELPVRGFDLTGRVTTVRVILEYDLDIEDE